MAAIKDQADLLCTISPAHVNAARSEAARLITDRTPAGLDHVFFTNGGADANEHAIRMARLHTGKHKVLSRYRSYHGGTETAVNVTGDPRRWSNDRGDSGVVHFFGPFLYRSEFSATTEAEETERALRHLERTIELEGPSTIAALILETIPGTAGIMLPGSDYMQGVRALCDKHDIDPHRRRGDGRVRSQRQMVRLRTLRRGARHHHLRQGRELRLRAPGRSDHGRRDLRLIRAEAYPGGLTYSGHPLACAAAVATLKAMDSEGMIEHAERIGTEIIGPRLRQIAENSKHVGEVRGVGAFWAIELVWDKETREPLAPYGGGSPEVASVVSALKEHGVVPFNNYHRLHVVPPINISEEDLETGLGVFEKVLTDLDFSR